MTGAEPPSSIYVHAWNLDLPSLRARAGLVLQTEPPDEHQHGWMRYALAEVTDEMVERAVAAHGNWTYAYSVDRAAAMRSALEAALGPPTAAFSTKDTP